MQNAVCGAIPDERIAREVRRWRRRSCRCRTRPSPFLPVYEGVRPPTIYGLDFFNSATSRVLHLSTASVEYVGYTSSDIISCILGKVIALAVPGELPHPFSLYYEADRYSPSTLHTNNAVKYLMAF